MENRKLRETFVVVLEMFLYIQISKIECAEQLNFVIKGVSTPITGCSGKGEASETKTSE